ncbi:MAG: hypothetical protein IPJ20_19630 [Flammeovirgaceae bacterium]|nr:hypothetical protein [Flammeovirgaceae bacterium]
MKQDYKLLYSEPAQFKCRNGIFDMQGLIVKVPAGDFTAANEVPCFSLWPVTRKGIASCCIYIPITQIDILAESLKNLSKKFLWVPERR